MYLSLDRIDITLEPVEGRPRFVQTDHRTAAEVAAELPLSIVATAIRCLNPRRAASNCTVFYNFPDSPPPRIHRTIEACGGLLLVGTDVSVIERPREHRLLSEADVTKLLHESLVELASNLLAVEPLLNPFDALRAREQLLVDQGFPDEDNTSEFWSTVLNLGALAGAAIRSSVGGQWFYHPASLGTLPVDFRATFSGEPATFNLLGKALKFLRGKGDGEEPSFLVQIACRGK